MEHQWLDITQLVWLAGMAQVVLSICSLAIPKVLNWRSELNKVQLLIKQMFWVYAAYILVINLCLGLISLFACNELTDGSALAKAFTGFIAVYWISRVAIQFLYFDRNGFPKGAWYTLGEVLLVGIFIALSMIYSFAFYYN